MGEGIVEREVWADCRWVTACGGWERGADLGGATDEWDTAERDVCETVGVGRN